MYVRHMASTPHSTSVTRKVEIDGERQEVRATRALRQSGGSTVVTIPPEMVDLLDLELGDDLELEAEWSGDEIRLRVVDRDEGVDDAGDG